MRITYTHVYFWHGPFSNWESCEFTDDFAGLTFRSSEQAFMYYKAVVFRDLATAAKIMTSKTPKEAKDLGRLVSHYDEKVWECVRFGYMVYVNYLKFTQNENLKKVLLDTDDRILVEASPYDKVWGVGLSEDNDLILDEANWQGQNLLGQALMKVRKIILTEPQKNHEI